ncbi:hypothetical protein KAJ87_01250 [Candidatus Pacearchaeota archaeon]|nr:hypothetical protein [Candidatus Pacearchaeota archaeon]
MPYTTKKKFEENYKNCKNYLKELESIKPKPKEEYPNIPDFGSCLKDIEEMTCKIHIDDRNNMIEHQNKYLKKEIKWCKKNLEDLTKSKKESIFGLINYKKIHTLDWGKLDMKDFRTYLNGRVRMYSPNPIEH